VVLLSLAAVVFFLLSLTMILPRQQGSASAAIHAAALHNMGDVLMEYNLSEREMEVALMLVHEGLSNEEMGERLFISKSTVKSHVYSIYQKFGVRKRAELLAKILSNNKGL
jgi:DNA-binding NarL/FixJ family response regulator